MFSSVHSSQFTVQCGRGQDADGSLIELLLGQSLYSSSPKKLDSRSLRARRRFPGSRISANIHCACKTEGQHQLSVAAYSGLGVCGHAPTDQRGRSATHAMPRGRRWRSTRESVGWARGGVHRAGPHGCTRLGVCRVMLQAPGE